MKALQYSQYGCPELIQWNEIAIPEPAALQILVQVKAESLNPTDIRIRMGFIKFTGADIFPKTMGMDFSGIVTKIGEDVTNVKVGDKVMGYMGAQGGSFADYTLADASTTLAIPANLSFETANTLPMNAATALKVVNAYLRPTAGKTILINGAAGGLGLFIVQYCKLKGATVSATASGAVMEVLKSLGVDEIIDYKTANILQNGKSWDAVVDTSGKLDFEDAKVLLNENGEFSTMVPKSAFGQPGRTDGTKKENAVFAQPGEAEFITSQKLDGEEKIKTFVGKTFLMKNSTTAITLFETGKLCVVGKVVLTA